MKNRREYKTDPWLFTGINHPNVAAPITITIIIL